MKTVVILLLALACTNAYYAAQTQCCAAGSFWDNANEACAACNASCTNCDENSETHDNNDLTGCVCAAANCTPGMCDATGCTQCMAVAAGETAYTLAGGACFTCADANCTSCPTAATTCAACTAGHALVAGAC